MLARSFLIEGSGPDGTGPLDETPLREAGGQLPVTSSKHKGSRTFGFSKGVRIARFFAGVRADLAFAVVDAVTVALAYWAALFLRFIDLAGVDARWWTGLGLALPLIIAVHLVFNALFGAYGHVWEFASVEEAMRLVAAAVASGVVLAGLVMALRSGGLTDGHLLPLMVVVMGAGLSVGLMGISRFRSRMFSFKRTGQVVERINTLVIGTGRAAADLARHSSKDGHPARVVAFASIESGANGQKLAGLPVVGSVPDVPQLVEMLDIHQVVVAEHVTDEVLRDLVDRCLSIDVRLRIAPDASVVLNGASSLRDVRDLVLTDLLPRPTVSTNLEAVRSLLAGRRVLVTGAGGSIGSEIVRQVCELEPGGLWALDNDETHLYEALLDLPSSSSPPTAVLADVRDREALLRFMADHRPEVVFHAAAHKHVPILESFPDEAVKTNVLGTANLIEVCRKTGVERFVLVSTDKAVDPTSVMGASKRVAEMLVQSAAAMDPTGGVFAAVRFGNVLGSRGSVVPTFMSQIRRGGPVTVSDPEMLRYFMTTAEAVHLVLQASALAEGGELFVLDMGEPVRIGDLARRMIRLAGLVPGRDIEIEVTGARAGEKHREVLSREPLEPGPHPKINIARETFPGPVTLLDAVETLAAYAESGDRSAVSEVLRGLAWQTWEPDDTIYLDQLALELDRS